MVNAMGEVQVESPTVSPRAFRVVGMAAYAVALADKGWQQGCRDDRSLALGLNTHAGHLTNAPVGEAVGIEAVGLESVLA